MASCSDERTDNDGARLLAPSPSAGPLCRSRHSLDGRIIVRRVLLLLAAAMPTSALACSCAVDAEASYRDAQQVRIVRILSVESVSKHPTLGYVLSATFEITETLKGNAVPAPDQLHADGMCSDRFEPGLQYLVALRAGESLVSFCSGSFSFPAAELQSDPRVARARRVLQGVK